jgi:lipoprotein-anchoring transpeptidase ErfK/SrfK
MAVTNLRPMNEVRSTRWAFEPFVWIGFLSTMMIAIPILFVALFVYGIEPSALIPSVERNQVSAAVIAATATPFQLPIATATRTPFQPLPSPTLTPFQPPTITPTPTVTPIAPLPLADVSSAPALGKWILVDISDQHLYAYENDVLIFSFVASTGMGNSTRIGTFSVLEKIPNAYGATWNIWMPDWLGIYWSGSLQNGIHSLPILWNGSRLWAGYLGTPISYGCIVLGVDESKMLYDWAEVGTAVVIQR